MLANFLGVLPILTPPLCALTFIMCSKSNPQETHLTFIYHICSFSNSLIFYMCFSIFLSFKIFLYIFINIFPLFGRIFLLLFFIFYLLIFLVGLGFELRTLQL
jgi:hypothetical protein